MRHVLIVLGLVAGLTLAATGQVNNFDVYKQSQDNPAQLIPDVNKTVPPPPPPNPGMTDNSCWMATAANILGAAGYGIGPNAQNRATGIYNQLAFDLGWWNTGQCQNAINYWLYTYGKNPGTPASPNPDYKPGNAYTDVTFQYGAIPLTPYVAPPGKNTGYNWLLDELVRCQYVGIQLGGTPDHCVTLVGGNYWNNPNGRPNGNVVLIHDSDFTKGNGPNPSDDMYTNITSVGGNWQILYDPLGPPGAVRDVTGWVTLCPGLNKPEYAVNNYDVAYYKADPDKNGVWTNVFREAGIKAPIYGDPVWYNETTLHLSNEQIPNQHKEVYLLVDYTDRVPGRAALENLVLQVPDPQNPNNTLNLAPTSVQPSADDGQLLFTWVLDYQPPWENIVFPSNEYNLLNGDVKDWDVATVCIPEPGVAGMMVVTALMVALRRRRAA